MNLVLITLTIIKITLIVVQGSEFDNEGDNKENDTKDLPEIKGNQFYYFGYGSNMLTKRIHMQNPTAVKIGAGILKNYRLDFHSHSKRWNGAPATVVPHFNRTVQGTLWQIDLSNLNDIDNQEGVPEGIYKPQSVSILNLKTNDIVTARVYHLVDQPVTDLNSLSTDNVPFNRQPSATYLQCLVAGAVETEIEDWYINWLRSLKHNGNVVKYFENALDLQDVKLSLE